MGNRVCPQCHTELDPEYAFCPECGSRLEEPEVSAGDATDSDIEAELVSVLQQELEATSEKEAIPDGSESGQESEPATAEKAVGMAPKTPVSDPSEAATVRERNTPEPAVKVVSRKAPSSHAGRFRIVRLARGGGQKAEYNIPDRGLVIGRVNVDVSFPDDDTVSPRHATLRPNGDSVDIEDTGSLNGLYTRLKGSHHLTEGDTFMCGDQLFRFSERTARFHAADFRLYSAPHEKMVLATLTHILRDGIEGEVYPIKTSSFRIGRDEGDLRFEADRFMSRKHAMLKKADKGFVLSDAGSRNGTYVCRRGTLALVDGDIFMIGRQMLRLEVVAK
ncbi:MAG: FHA domain-containing protein [Deltaproteobacteria bacterium]|nr:FHA domain-containing protein [Deltaproteobacteria bacterium]